MDGVTSILRDSREVKIVPFNRTSDRCLVLKRVSKSVTVESRSNGISFSIRIMFDWSQIRLACQGKSNLKASNRNSLLLINERLLNSFVAIIQQE